LRPARSLSSRLTPAPAARFSRETRAQGRRGRKASGTRTADVMSQFPPPRPPAANAALVLADGSVFWGHGLGAVGRRVGELCFNTAMTGYQEIMTDPSYAGQIVTFTFPHIG